MNSPSERLAEKIIQKLVQEKLISPQVAKKLLPGLAGGDLQAESWRAAIESGVTQARPWPH